MTIVPLKERPWELICFFYGLRVKGKVAIMRNEPHVKHPICSHLDHRHLSLQSCEKYISVVYKLPSLQYCCKSSTDQDNGFSQQISFFQNRLQTYFWGPFSFLSHFSPIFEKVFDHSSSVMVRQFLQLEICSGRQSGSSGIVPGASLRL